MLNDKLNKREDEVMNAVFTLADGKEQVLVSPYEIIALLPPKENYDEEKLEGVLRALELDGYFELIASDRKGEKMYVIHLKPSGLAYKRSDTQRKRGLYIKLGITVATAVLSFAIGLILKAIFT
ncbi:MAG: hypothetical protein K2L87_01315 [Clostridiales bacterium]|nr:hypothetical protein [Clostridiales bacterium]